MRLASINDAFKLGVRQDSIYDQARRQMRPIGWLRRCDRGHRCGLYEFCRMRMRSGNTDRLQSISFIKRIGESDAFRRSPFDRLVGEFYAFWCRDRRCRRRTRCRSPDRSWDRRTSDGIDHDRSDNW